MNTFKAFIEKFNANKLNNVKVPMISTKNKELACLASVRFVDVLKDKFFDTEFDSVDAYSLKNRGSYDNFIKRMARVDQESLNEQELMMFDKIVRTFTVDAVRLFASRILDRTDLEKYPIYVRKTNKWRVSHWGPVNPNGNPVKDDLSGFVDPEPVSVNGEQFMFKVPYGYDVVYEEYPRPELYEELTKYEDVIKVRKQLYEDIASGDKILCYDVPVNKYLYYNEYLVNINDKNIPNGVLTALGKFDSRYEMSNIINSLYKAYGGDVLGTLADKGREYYHKYCELDKEVYKLVVKLDNDIDRHMNHGIANFITKSLYRGPVMSTLNKTFTKNVQQDDNVFEFAPGKDAIRYVGDQERSIFYSEIFEKEFDVDKTNHYVGSVYDKCRCSYSYAKNYYNHKDESYKMFTILKLVKFLKNQILPIVNLYKKNDQEILALKEFVIGFVNNFDVQSLNDRYFREIEFLNDFDRNINNPGEYIQKAKKYADDVGFKYNVPNLIMLKSNSFAVRTTISTLLCGIYMDPKYSAIQIVRKDEKTGEDVYHFLEAWSNCYADNIDFRLKCLEYMHEFEIESREDSIRCFTASVKAREASARAQKASEKARAKTEYLILSTKEKIEWNIAKGYRTYEGLKEELARKGIDIDFYLNYK